MDNTHRPEASPKKYAPVEIPKFGDTVTVQGSKFILRDDDGSSIFEGEILVERASGTGHSTVIMSRAMAERMLAYLTTKSVGTMKSNIVNALTADEEETIRGDVQKFVESSNSARPQDRQAQQLAWHDYLNGLYSTQRDFAFQECDKQLAELIAAGNYYKNHETSVDTDEQIDEHDVRNRARTHADNVFNSMTHEKEQNTEYWVIYLCSLSESDREIARLAYDEHKKELTEKTEQADNDIRNRARTFADQTNSLYKRS